MSILDDGAGRGYKASVSIFNRLNVSSKSNPRIYYISRLGYAFSIISSYSASSGDTVLYLKNTDSERKLVISGIWASADNNAFWDINIASGTPSGTTLTPKNLNLSQSVSAQGTFYGDAAITGITANGHIAHTRSPAFTTAVMDFKEALILGNQDAIIVKYTGTAGAIDVVAGFYFENQSGVVV